MKIYDYTNNIKYHIKMKDCEWFKDKEPLILEAKNSVEREKRLQWLSEGTLHNNMDTKPPDDMEWGSNGGSRKEKKLFQEFIKHLNNP